MHDSVTPIRLPTSERETATAADAYQFIIETFGVDATNLREAVIEGRMSEEQLQLYAIHNYIDEVNNGGHWQYLTNASADTAPEAIAGYRKLGMHSWADRIVRSFERTGFRLGALQKERLAYYDQLMDLPDDSATDTADDLDKEVYRLEEEGPGYEEYLHVLMESHAGSFFEQNS